MRIKYLFFSCLIMTYIGCDVKNQNDILKTMLMGNELQGVVEHYFPVHLINTDGISRDTITIITTSDHLYHAQGIYYSFTAKEFSKLLFNELKLNNGYLYVNDCVFKDELDNKILESCPEVDSIYEDKGIKGVLSHYLTSEGELITNSSKIDDYIINLCFSNKIYFSFVSTSNTLGTYVWNESINK